MKLLYTIQLHIYHKNLYHKNYIYTIYTIKTLGYQGLLPQMAPAVCKGQLSAVIFRLVCEAGRSGREKLKNDLPFWCCTMICECSREKTRIEKKDNIEFNTENRQKTQKAQEDKNLVSQENWYQMHTYINQY